MKAKLLFFFILFFSVQIFALDINLAAQENSSETLKARQWVNNSGNNGFIENKGQMCDMNGAPTPFVLFKTETQGLTIYITEKGITYNFSEFTYKKDSANAIFDFEKQKEVHARMFRIDAEIKDASIKKENIELLDRRGAWHYNYFYPHCNSGLYDVKEYKKIRIKNIYPGINWVLYTNEEGIKYDFEVAPGADLSKIKILYTGAEKIIRKEDGSLTITSPLGNIEEKTPVSFENNLKLNSEFIIQNENEISFSILGHNSSNRLVIDPQLVWGTLLAGNSGDGIESIECDNNGNVFVIGGTYSSNFPTLNAGTYFDSTINAQGDMYIMKFDNNGVLLWSTYYGGSQADDASSIGLDNNGNVFITGGTTSADFPVMNSGGYFDSSINGSSDVVIIKFSNSGTLLWSTFIGGSGGEGGLTLAEDLNDNLFIVGSTTSNNFPTLSNGGYFDNTMGGNSDGFILEFSNTNNLIWASYYGGSSHDFIGSVTSDAIGNIFITGTTYSSNFPLLNSIGYYDNTLGGNFDGFISKFNSAGALLWSSYYGGSNDDGSGIIKADSNGNIFVVGSTYSNDIQLQNAGTYYDSIYNYADFFILKFTNAGNLTWATYFGGTGAEGFSTYDAIAIDKNNNLFIALETSSSNIPIATTTSPCSSSYVDSTLSLSYFDCYIAEFSNNGILLWSSYIGNNINTQQDFNSPLSSDPFGNIFMGCNFQNYPSASGPPLLNPGGGTYYNDIAAGPSGTFDGFICKFIPDVFSISVNSSNGSCTCTDTATVSLQCGFPPLSYQWNNGQTTQTITGLCGGTYSVVVTDAANSTATASVAVTASPIPVASITGNTSICAGINTTLVGSGGSSYSWSSGETTSSINVSATGSYSVIVSIGNCYDTASVFVIVNPGPVANVSADITITQGQSVTLSSSGGGNYSWSNGVINSMNIVFPDTTSMYCITVTDANNCSDTACVTVTVEPVVDCTGELYVPNAFSPNGDLENDELQIFIGNFDCIKSLNISIYNRWGEKVFESSDISFKWDGFYQKKKQETGVYTYFLNTILNDDTELNRKGNVSILR